MTKNKETNKRQIRNDILFVAVLLFLVAVGGIYLFLLRGSGDTVRVTVNGELYAVYSLSEDRVEDICTGEDGSQLNRLIIRDGKAYVETATCPDGICKNHRAIYRDGESIVCLPHRVVITVDREDQTDAPDVIA